MTDTERILAAIDNVNKAVTVVNAHLNRRIDDIETRVKACEESTAAKIQRQDETVKALTRKVSELAHSDAAVWKSHDQLEIGIDRESAYEAFRELGIRRRDALKTLEALGILRRGGSHMTKSVRKGDRIIRAVVIMEE